MSALDPRAVQQARLNDLMQADRARTRQQRIDAYLRAWPGVAFAILSRDLGLPADLLSARARQIGLPLEGAIR